MDIDEISKIIESNANKPFVKRIINRDDYPVLANQGGDI